MHDNSLINVKIIVGSTRQGRFSQEPSHWLYDQAKKREDFETELLDLRDYKLPFFNEPISPAMLKVPFLDSEVARWTEKIKTADGYIVVTPEYNHGYPAVLKNAFDYVYKEWNNKPIGFLSYGGAGGARSVEQLRQVAIELQMAPIRNAIHMPLALLYDEKWQLKPDAFDAFVSSATGLFDQLLWWAHTLKSARNK